MSWWISRETLCTGESLTGELANGSQEDAGGPVCPLELEHSSSLERSCS